jgi:pimeloyl-ACP methyl ester carboxylesterase
MEVAIDSPQTSTTGRLKPIPIPPWVRTSFKLTASVAPGLAVTWANRVFFTPRRAPVRSKESEALNAAETFTLRSGGRTLSGWAWKGDGSPILLVHGWGGHTGQMTPLATALAAAGHRVVGVDMPGHGRSQGSQSSLVHFTGALESAAALFGPFAGVVAHSFGCAAATLAFSKSFAVRRAVFIAPPAGFGTFWDRFCDGLGVPPRVWERVIAASQERLQVTWSDTVPAALAPRLRIPLRILHDRNDNEISYSEGVQLAALWPGAELVTTSGLGHNRILRDTATVGAAVEFLAAN